MKKHLHNSLRALFLSLAVLLSLPMLAVEVTIDGINYELVAKAKQATVIAKSSGKYSGEVVIPESVEHEGAAYSVTSIGDYAFKYCSGLTSVTIPNSVKSIGSGAFQDCSGLTSVHISDIAVWCNIDFSNYESNPLSYAHHLYLNGEEVKDLVLPNSVTSIKEQTFYGCSGLTSVAIPNSVTSIGENAFVMCSGLTSVTIPNSVTSIGRYAFDCCSGLTSVTIPNSVTSIGDGAFGGCSGLTSVTIPNSVTSIGDFVFDGCSGLTSVTIPNSVESIGAWSFGGCSGLTSVSIPNSVKSIGRAAFSWCSGLSSVTIPNSVESIEEYAFECCSSLTSVTIPSSVESIGEHAFECCSSLTSVTIPSSVTSIGDYAFNGCSGLTSVTIGNSVTSIGEYAFYECYELCDVYCYAENVPSTRNNAFDGSYPEYVTLHVPDVSIDSYKATAPWSSFGKIVGLSGENFPEEDLPKGYDLTLSSVGYATLFLDFNAEIPANVKAYVVAKVEANRLKMERVEGVLSANTGVIILANDGTYTFTESDATPATIGDNLLYGTVATTQISTDPVYYYYVLSKVDGIVGMYRAKLTDGKFQNNANKAYMKLKKGDLNVFDDEVDSSIEQLSRSFVFDFGDETAIDEVSVSGKGQQPSVLYDLSGRRVQKGQMGVFVREGKIVVQ